MYNYLSIDLESWASPPIPKFVRLTGEDKKKLDNGHIKKSAIEILRILKKNRTKLTFFLVGQLYDWYPEVVEMIASQGHEIAYHTHYHDAVFDEKSLIEGLDKSKKFLQRFKPIGFRAPRISLKNDNLLKILNKYGFRYDSSIYGKYEERKITHGITQFPVTSIAGIPVGSGYFIGLLGRNIKWLYKAINKTGNPVLSFIHNWQILKPINPTFPDRLYLLTHPHYLPYLADCSSAFAYLIGEFRFRSMKNLL